MSHNEATSGPDQHAEHRANERHDAQIRRRQTIRLAVLGVLAALAVILAIDNSQSVTISYLIGSATAPLVFALVIAFALGVAVGYLINWRRQKH